jgi:erythromycin esterase-like protein
MPVPPAQKRSWEDLLHSISPSNKIILSSEIQQNATLQQSIGQRAIGVRYYPNSERGNYVPSIIPKRYDAFLYIDQTNALRPLGTTAKDEPDTYPSGY